MPTLSVSTPFQNQVVTSGQPFAVTGVATDRGMPEPNTIDSVTVRVDNGPAISANLTPLHGQKRTAVSFSASATARGAQGRM